MWGSFWPTPRRPSKPLRIPVQKNLNIWGLMVRQRASCPRRGHPKPPNARCACRFAAVGAGPSLFQVRAVARKKTTCRTLQHYCRKRYVIPRCPHQQVQDRKPRVNEHKRVLFTVITLPQAALPLGNSACNHASESLDTGSAGRKCQRSPLPPTSGRESDFSSTRRKRASLATGGSTYRAKSQRLSKPPRPFRRRLAPAGAHDRLPTDRRTGPDCLAGQA